MILEDLASPVETVNRQQLDELLTELCELLVAAQKKNPEFFGMVAAGILDPANRFVVGINFESKDGTRVHAERAAIQRYKQKFGEIPKGSICVTTLSPCNRPMEERYGESCSDLLDSEGIRYTYCGYRDPSQDHDLSAETTNLKLKTLCRAFADTFLQPQLNEESNKEILKYVKKIHPKGEFTIDHAIMNHAEWELENVPLTSLHIDDAENDPYSRVQFIDYDHVDSITLQDIKSKPIVIDANGWIIDGNHRAARARDLGMTTIPAYVPVEDPDHETYDQFMARSKVSEDQEEYSGITVDYRMSDDKKYFYVKALSGDGNKELGSVDFTNVGNGWEGDHLWVDERYRGQGIATTMYDFAKEKLGKIVPSADRTDDGMAFWRGKTVWEDAQSSKAKEFISKVYDQYPDWPYGQADKVMVWGEGEEQQFAAFKLKPGTAPDTVEIDWIMAGPEQRKGVGSRAIKELQRQAQEAGIRLTLYPWAKGNVSQASLTKLYKRHGFKPVAKGAKPMAWEPELNELKIDNVKGLGAVPYNQEVDYMGLRVMMKPSKFLELSLPLQQSTDDKKTIDYLAQQKDDRGFGAPFLEVDMEKEFPRIVGHDGRHRMEAIRDTEGDHPVEVHIFPRYMRNRDMTPEVVDKLNDLIISQRGKYVVGPVFTQSVNEGWRDVAATAATVSALAMGGGDAVKNQFYSSAPNSEVTQQSSGSEVQRPPKPVPENELSKILKSTAKKAGIQGTELSQFMAQCAHESANFSSMKEFGGKRDFAKYDPKTNPKKAKSLGNTKAGDGARYHGRGFIQLTGRENYRKAGEALGLPLEKHPELVERPDIAAKVAVWYWQSRVQPKVTDYSDTHEVTKPINSGLKGLEDRHDKFRFYQVAKL